MMQKISSKTKRLIIILAVVAVLVIGLLSICAYAGSRDLTVPGISLNGVDLGNCTKEQVEERIGSLTAETLGYKTLTVRYTDDICYEITTAQAGIDTLNIQLCEKIYTFDRDGGFFSNGFSYIGHIFSKTELSCGEFFTVDEETVGGYVREKTAEALTEINETYKIVDDTLVLTKGAKAIHINPDNVLKMVIKSYETMDFSDVVYDADESSAKEIDLNEIYQTLHSEKVEATYNKTTGEITDDVVGIDFDLDAAAELYNKAADGEKVAIALIVDRPKMSADVLRNRLFKELLSEKSTPLSGGSNRVNNIKLAAAAINGTILMPGEEFSFNKIVGQRTAAKGYLEAGAYVGDETVQQVGGGICQVSSTVFCCTLLANLKYTARDNHMFPVSYLPYGMDATVNWPNLDYKFVNSANYPIKITTKCEGGYLTVQFWGVNERNGHYYELTYKVTGYTEKKTEYKDDPTLSVGEEKVERKGFNGVLCDTYRNEYDENGKLVKTEFITHNSYKSQSQIILRGTKPVDNPDNPDNPDTPDTPDTPDEPDNPDII